MKKKEINIPIGLKIISIIFYLISLLYIIPGLISFMSAIFYYKIIQKTLFLDKYSLTFLLNIEPQFLFIFSLVFLIFGLLSIFIARGLWEIQNWARISAVIILVFTLILEIIVIGVSQLDEILIILITAGFICYLVLNKELNELFL